MTKKRINNYVEGMSVFQLVMTCNQSMLINRTNEFRSGERGGREGERDGERETQYHEYHGKERKGWKKRMRKNRKGREKRKNEKSVARREVYQ